MAYNGSVNSQASTSQSVSTVPQVLGAAWYYWENTDANELSGQTTISFKYKDASNPTEVDFTVDISGATSRSNAVTLINQKLVAEGLDDRISVEFVPTGTINGNNVTNAIYIKSIKKGTDVYLLWEQYQPLFGSAPFTGGTATN